jgi:hypothetical protein
VDKRLPLMELPDTGLANDYPFRETVSMLRSFVRVVRKLY